MDLTPRSESPDAASARRRGRKRWVPMAVVAITLVAGGVVVTQFLTSAIDYYCNVDEVGRREGCDGDRRMRVQGIVDEGSVAKGDGATSFTMSFHGESIDVRYLGDPGGVFQECIPVVAHGRMENGVFDSDRIEVKHSNQYVEKNTARMGEADQEAAACSVSKD